MAGRSSTTFKKRQKELARQDKQREKAAKREQRKQHKLREIAILVRAGFDMEMDEEHQEHQEP